MAVDVKLFVALYLGLWQLSLASSATNVAQQDVNIVFVVLSEKSSYHASTVERLSRDIKLQADRLNWAQPILYSTSKDWAHIPGAWAVLPVLGLLSKRHAKSSSWFLFCEDVTSVDLSKLGKFLSLHNSSEEHFFGHQLWDTESTIIHHFDDPKSLAYPDLAAGMVLSAATLKKAASTWDTAELHDFVIDRQYEFAKFISNVCGGPDLQDVRELCLYPREEHCASWTAIQAPSCGTRVQVDNVVFAVKSCTKYHQERVPVVKATWYQDARNVLFFSDSRNSTIPTIDLGVKNTERGHCTKTMKILDYIASHNEHAARQWLVLADDDTLLSVPRLLDLLSCFSPDQRVVLGERYGFGILSGRGYDYPTGGSGIVLSIKTVKELARSHCFCPSEDSPDDMMLGICLQQLKIDIVHSPLFHQARPMDYSADLLAHQRPISFHKFWMMDPIQAYSQWLLDTSSTGHLHDEH